MRVVAVTQIWPNRLEPISSPFNRQQFRELARSCELSVICAIASVPGASFASRLGRKDRTAMLSALPARDIIEGIDTINMRQWYVPRYGVPVAVPLYLASLAPHIETLRRADVILATWAYPDGCAAVLAAKALGKPCVVKVHGSDINVIAKRRTPKAVIERVLPDADAVVTVSRALGRELMALGVPEARIALVQNGVDANVFAPRNRLEARKALGIAPDGKLVLFVGRLEPQKGVSELLAAFENMRARVAGARLALVGEGVSQGAVDAAKARWGDALLTPGPQPLEKVAAWMAACDVFTLPSWMEGTPNVVLEALASGRPVVASRVGGIPDVLGDPRAGVLVDAKSPASLEAGLVAALSREWPEADVAACGPGSWNDSAEHLRRVLEKAVAHHR